MSDITTHFEDLASGWAERYDSSPSFQRRLEVVGSMVTRHLQSKPSALVLDLGTGAGVFAMVASGSARRVIAVEPNQAMVRVARRDLGFAEEILRRRGIQTSADRISLINGDLTCMRPRNYAFDMVTAIAVLEYLEDPVPTAEALRACLNEGGLLCVTWPSPRSLFRGIERVVSRGVAFLGRRTKSSVLHSRDYVLHQSGVTTREWKSALAGAGFVQVERVGMSMGHRGWRWLARPSEVVVFAARAVE